MKLWAPLSIFAFSFLRICFESNALLSCFVLFFFQTVVYLQKITSGSPALTKLTDSFCSHLSELDNCVKNGGQAFTGLQQ